MITRKDFKAIAEIIVIAKPDQRQMNLHGERARGINESRLYIARQLADYFATQNPRFGRQKFFNACGL